MPNKCRPHREIAAIALEQHGVVSAGQLRALGCSRAKIAEEVGAGHLHPLHRGVYAVGHLALTREGRCLAAVLSCGDGALLSHRSAAWLWGLTKRWREPIEVTATTKRRSRDGIDVFSSARIASEDTAIAYGVLVTAVPRTMLDFAAVDPIYLPQALNAAARLGLLDVAAVDALLRRSRGLRGAARLRLAIEDHRDPAFTRSGLERTFLRLVKEAGLARPSANAFVSGYELDMYWPAERLAVELDTYDYHGGRAQFESDRIRDEDLRLAGIEVTRITGMRLRQQPRLVMQRIATLLAQRRRGRRLLSITEQKATSAGEG